MITISHQGNGYKIKLSWPGTGQRGYSVHAKDLPEVHQAIDHYYGSKPSHQREPVETCPLCKKGQ